MPCAKNYTVDNVNDVLTQSEGRNSPVSNQAGHALALHMEVQGNDISDRLMRTGAAVGVPTTRRNGTLTGSLEHHRFTSPGRAFIVGPAGEIANQNQTLKSWQSHDYRATVGTGPLPTDADRSRGFRNNISNNVSASGAFKDRQQAIRVAQLLLNSAVGQAQLAALDSGSQERVKIELAVPPIDATTVTMYAAGTGAGASDITTQLPVGRAVMIVDRLPTGDIHVQTFYPTT